jgi:hypothetical protein
MLAIPFDVVEHLNLYNSAKFARTKARNEVNLMGLQIPFRKTARQLQWQ